MTGVSEHERGNRWTVLAAVAFAAGVLVRTFAEYPVHKYPADADALLLPIRGIQILHARLSALIGAARAGGLESILHAAAFAIFGISRASAAVAPLVLGCSSPFLSRTSSSGLTCPTPIPRYSSSP